MADDADIESRLLHELRHHGLLSDEEQVATLISQVQSLARNDVEAIPMLNLIPLATHVRRLLLRATGRGALVPVIELLERYAGKQDIPNDDDERNGVIDIGGLRAAAAADINAAIELLNMHADSGVHGRRAALIMLAALGQRRDQIEKDARALHQVQIKAFGALPLAEGEIVETRFAALQSIQAAGRRFNNTRRQHIAAAVKAALHNLAQQTGFADGNALAADQQTAAVTSSTTVWVVGDYTLTLDPAKGSLSAMKVGRPLKSIPAALRQSPEYAQAKAASASLRREVSRLRREVLEARMASGTPFSAEDLKALWSLPAARPLMTALLWVSADGATGTLAGPDAPLLDINRRAYPAEPPLRLVHPYDLYVEGTLSAWQKRVVRDKLVQPFKQVFRELYVLTPAEMATGTFSNRFASHAVSRPTAWRLFESRDWRIRSISGMSIPTKVSGGLRAAFPFDTSTHGAIVTTGRIFFSIDDAPLTWDWQSHQFLTEPLPLEDVPPLFFSEVMRDADLVTAVAQSEGGGQISAESYAARGAVVATLIEDLGLPGVRVDGHFAHVTGKRAKYRVHLGNAAIHIDPGNYLCIVPDRTLKQKETIYLPFAAEGDRKVSEVISKIMLLLNDDKITDPTILRQLLQSCPGSGRRLRPKRW
jgi:hypothetical protein